MFETADYMATFVDYDPQRKQYVLGPGVASADEKHTDYAHNLNPDDGTGLLEVGAGNGTAVAGAPGDAAR